MALSLHEKVEIGRQVRLENSTTKELAICERYGLEQVGGSRTKVDGSRGDRNWSIKNATSSSTQVHLTTGRKFIEDFSLTDGKSDDFVRKFFGHIDFNHKSRNRYTMSEIDKESVKSFSEFLNENKKRLVEYVISGLDGKFGITDVLYNYKGTHLHATANEIYDIADECEWLLNETTFHLKRKSDNRTMFHFQMKGSGNKAKMGYHAVLCHIHKNLFIKPEER
jgi:hypothetical protein